MPVLPIPDAGETDDEIFNMEDEKDDDVVEVDAVTAALTATAFPNLAKVKNSDAKRKEAVLKWMLAGMSEFDHFHLLVSFLHYNRLLMTNVETREVLFQTQAVLG